MKTALISLLAALAVAGNVTAQSLTVWTPLEGRSLAWLQQQAEAFTEGFEVEVEVVSLALGELRERSVAATEEGTGADLLVGVPHDQVAELVTAGVLADLAPYATASYLADLPDPARQAYTFGGRLLGLPLFFEGPALIVNTELVPTVPTSYRELLEVAEDRTGEENYGFGFDLTNFYYAFTWINSFNGYLFGSSADGTADASDLGLATDGAVAGARALQALRFEHRVVPPDTDYRAITSLFAQGKLAMTYDGPWAIAGFQAAGIPVDVAPLPPRADGLPWSGFMGVYGVLVTESSEDRVAAANLAKWLVQPGAQLELARSAGRIPVAQSLLEQAEDLGIIAGFAAALQNAEPLPVIPELGGVWEPMTRALTAITNDPEANVEAALERAVQEIGSR